MTRLLHALVVGVIGAGIVHIAILFLLPHFSERDAWSRLALAADFYRLIEVSGDKGSLLGFAPGDPLFRVAACRFDLDDGIVQVRSPEGMPFWSVSVYDRGGQNLYSFNDRVSEAPSLDVVVLTPEQMIEVRKQLPEDLDRSIFVELPIGQGIFVVRAFVPDASWKATADAFFSNASCRLI